MVVTDVVAVDSDWSTVPGASTTYSIYEGMLFNLAPNQVTQVRRPFYNASADIAGGVNKDYFEKIFAVNNNTSIALTAVQISRRCRWKSFCLTVIMSLRLSVPREPERVRRRFFRVKDRGSYLFRRQDLPGLLLSRLRSRPRITRSL